MASLQPYTNPEEGSRSWCHDDEVPYTTMHVPHLEQLSPISPHGMNNSTIYTYIRATEPQQELPAAPVEERFYREPRKVTLPELPPSTSSSVSDRNSQDGEENKFLNGQ